MWSWGLCADFLVSRSLRGVSRPLRGDWGDCCTTSCREKRFCPAPMMRVDFIYTLCGFLGIAGAGDHDWRERSDSGDVTM